MKRSLQGKLILSYLAVALITVLVVSALIRLTSGQSLMSLVVEAADRLAKRNVPDLLQSNGSLDGFFAYYFQPTGSTGLHPSQADAAEQTSG